MKKVYLTTDDLPIYLTVNDLAALLRISRSSAYELAREPGFPKLKSVLGRIVIPRDKMLEWLENNAK